MAVDQQDGHRADQVKLNGGGGSADEQEEKPEVKVAPQKSGLTWTAPETYFAMAAFVGVIVLIVVLIRRAPTSDDALWGRMLTIANGPGAVFVAILGAILGFSANQLSLKSAKTEKEKAEAEKKKAVEEKEDSAAKVKAIKGLLNKVPVAEIEARREDSSSWVQNLVDPSHVSAEAGQMLRTKGSYELAQPADRAPIDPLLTEVSGIIVAARDICNDHP